MNILGMPIKDCHSWFIALWSGVWNEGETLILTMPMNTYTQTDNLFLPKQIRVGCLQKKSVNRVRIKHKEAINHSLPFHVQL